MTQSIGQRAANGDSYKPIVTSPAAKGRLRQGFLLRQHFSELVDGSGIAPDLAALNAASFGPGTERHWESERSELTRFARHQIQTASVTGT